MRRGGEERSGSPTGRPGLAPGTAKPSCCGAGGLPSRWKLSHAKDGVKHWLPRVTLRSSERLWVFRGLVLTTPHLPEKLRDITNSSLPQTGSAGTPPSKPMEGTRATQRPRKDPVPGPQRKRRDSLYSFLLLATQILYYNQSVVETSVDVKGGGVRRLRQLALRRRRRPALVQSQER